MNIQLATLEDACELMAFIDKHWSQGHVLSRSKKLLDWQHLDMSSGLYNYLLARNPEGLIEGVLGFIPTSRYDEGLTQNTVCFLSLWKVIDTPSNPMLGLLMLRHLESMRDWSAIGTLGVSETAAQLYKLLGYDSGVLGHYYMANSQLNNFVIALSPRFTALESSTEELRQIFDLSELGTLQSDHIPYKSIAYIINRYLEHPFYNYRVYSVGGNASLLIVRLVEYNGSKVFRIVDLIGDSSLILSCSSALQALLLSENAEYIDLMLVGPVSEELEGAGWAKLDHDLEETIIPHYFEPFKKKNIQVGYAFKSLKASKVKYSLFRGDADQDRPNIL